MSRIKLTDTTMRDGSHTVSHQFSIDEVKALTKALDSAGVDIIEVGHGDGLTGSTINYGFSIHSDEAFVEAASSVAKNADIAVLLIPGIGTVEDLKRVKSAGAKIVRVATHVTEADISAQHIQAAKKMGFFTVGFLMMAHMASVERITEEARKMESYGADVVYCTDSAGAMLPGDVREKINALRSSLKIPVGFHSHNNLGVAIGNSIAAIEMGADYIDASLCGMGAGAGNTATETLVSVLNKLGRPHNCDLYKIIDAGVEVLQPILKKHNTNIPLIHDSLLLGYAGVYSSFMLHAHKAAKRFGVDYRDIIVEAGRRQVVGGQEDWLVEIASILSAKEV